MRVTEYQLIDHSRPETRLLKNNNADLGLWRDVLKVADGKLSRFFEQNLPSRKKTR